MSEFNFYVSQKTVLVKRFKVEAACLEDAECMVANMVEEQVNRGDLTGWDQSSDKDDKIEIDLEDLENGWQQTVMVCSAWNNKGAVWEGAKNIP
jgi:hypothetical protein